MRQTYTRQHRGFSLIELLVVMIVILILGGMVFAILQSAQRGTATEAGANIASAAVSAARAYATRPRADLDPEIVGSEFSGVALLFHGNEMRLVENDQRAISTGGNLLEEMEDKRNGFRDVRDASYYYLPKGAAVAGIFRNNNESVTIIPPPFAILFDKHGRLVTGRPTKDSNDRLVYYDGDYDGKIAVSKGRGNRYNIRHYDRNAPEFEESNIHQDSGRIKVPLDEIDTVIGVIVYPENRFRNNRGPFPETRYGNFVFRGLSLSGKGNNADSAIVDWLFENGRVLLFSRYSGAAIRETERMSE